MTLDFRIGAGGAAGHSEINGDDAKLHRGSSPMPNCTTAIALMAIYSRSIAFFHVQRVFAASYQAVSGSARRAIAELEEQVRAASEIVRRARKSIRILSPSMSSPQVDDFSKVVTPGEMKMQTKARIMHHPQFCASVTCVRVPVTRAFRRSSAEFFRAISVERAREILAKAPGLELIDDRRVIGIHASQLLEKIL